MGCTTCGRSSRTSTPTIQAAPKVQSTEDCEFSIEVISIWLERAKCVESNGLYTQIPNTTKRQVKAYVGALISAKNYANNPCHFRNELEEIESFMTVLTALNLCTNI